MRLIDADALKKRIEDWFCAPERCGNIYNGVKCRACSWDDAMSYVDSEPTVECVPLIPLARWLAGYAFPPELKARKIVASRERGIHEVAAEGWEDFLRGMDWRADDADD